MKNLTLSHLLCLFIFGLTFVSISPAPAHAAAPDLKTNVATLQERGFIKAADADYWLKNAAVGKTCDGAKVADLIIACVSIKKKVSDLKEACKYLQTSKTIKNPDYWLENAVAGKKCQASKVSSLFSRLVALTAPKK